MCQIGAKSTKSHVIRQMVSEIDNETVDIGRTLAAVTVIVFLFLSVYSVMHGEKFDAQAFGIGAGSVFAGLGGYIAMKREKRPEANNEQAH